MKRSLRNEILAKRKAQSAEERAAKSKLIMHELIGLPEFREAKVVAFYLPVNGEVDTTEMIKWAHQEGKEVCVPVVHEQKKMCMVVYEPLDRMKNGRYKIPEPVGKPERHHVDLVVVPGVVFDRRGHRIGMGRGCYDYFLKNKKCVNVGICFGFQLVDEIPAEPHDVPVNIIVTEHGVVRM
ncbi:5-formyltetrahydrofolate cyclo-ligase [Candidatus Micrarchaeota archaeon]|nr:5-formyltetrahydrofolate cyclo-ligase [Candidatus Micrarchaeota archaeon]